ncbi:MAG: hypothetical protein RLZZ299_185 [Pseudomonadota bacterium]|jgi:hypothetical protein
MPDEVCNIGPGGRKVRRLMGLAMLAGSGAMFAILVRAGMPRPVRAGLFVPLLFGMLGVMQARDGVCVALAAKDLQDSDDGPVAVTDAYARARLRVRARATWWKAGTIALVGTVLAVLA